MYAYDSAPSVESTKLFVIIGCQVVKNDLIYSFYTGLPTKNTTSTKTVESLSSLVLTNSLDCNRSLTVFLFPIFKNVYKGQTKSKGRHPYKCA